MSAAHGGGGERGEGMIAALLLLAGALLPLVFLIGVVGRVEQASLAAAQAAQAAVRAAAEAPDAPTAHSAAALELAAAQRQTPASLSLSLAGSFARGGTLQAIVVAALPLARLPLLGDLGTITLSAVARDGVDRYRSLPPP